MGTKEFIIAILGTNGVCLIINALIGLIKAKLREKPVKECADKTKEVDVKLDKLIGTIDKLETVLDCQTEGIKYSLLPQIQAEGRRLCKLKTISSKEYEQFCEMYNTYKALGGDGFADMIKASVSKKFFKKIDEELNNEED